MDEGLLSALAEFEEHDAFVEELKLMVLFSLHHKVPFQEVLSMPRGRYEYLINVIYETNSQSKRDSSLLNAVGNKGGVLGAQ